MKIVSLWEADSSDGPIHLTQSCIKTNSTKQKREVMKYLVSGAIVLATDACLVDNLDPKKPKVVPVGYLTDGKYIWPNEMIYYLDRYDILPPKWFLDHISENGFRVPDSAKDTTGRALEALRNTE